MKRKVKTKSWGILADGDYPYLTEDGYPFLVRSEKAGRPWLEKGERIVPVEVIYNVLYKTKAEGRK